MWGDVPKHRIAQFGKMYSIKVELLARREDELLVIAAVIAYYRIHR